MFNLWIWFFQTPVLTSVGYERSSTGKFSQTHQQQRRKPELKSPWVRMSRVDGSEGDDVVHTRREKCFVFHSNEPLRAETVSNHFRRVQIKLIRPETHAHTHTCTHNLQSAGCISVISRAENTQRGNKSFSVQLEKMKFVILFKSAPFFSWDVKIHNTASAAGAKALNKKLTIHVRLVCFVF